MNEYDKFLKFCEENGYNLLEFQKGIAKSILDKGNKTYIILPRQHGRKVVIDMVKEFMGG